jgi:hypothetical protein
MLMLGYVAPLDSYEQWYPLFKEVLQSVDFINFDDNPKNLSASHARLLEMLRERDKARASHDPARESKEQKSWEAKQDPIVIKTKETFSKATHEEQKQILESLGGPGALDTFKRVLVLEHAGNFKEALAVYESLLSEKEAIVAQMGIDVWVMLYPAIQRTAELSGNQGKEKEALKWIRDQLLNPEGFYHASLSRLEPSTISHIQDRMRVVFGTSEEKTVPGSKGTGSK